MHAEYLQQSRTVIINLQNYGNNCLTHSVLLCLSIVIVCFFPLPSLLVCTDEISVRE